MKKNLKKYQDFLKENNVFNYKNVDDYLSTWSISDDNYIGKFEGKNFEEITKNHQDWLRELREDFAECIKSCAMGGSFSDLCKRKDDPEVEFSEIEKELFECGWNFESIENLFNDIVNTKTSQGFDEFVNSFGLNSENGLVDVYLYKLAEKLGLDPNVVRLGGGGWSDFVKEDKEETIIRYRYGYHHTKYGQLMLDQIGWSKSFFVETSLTYLVEHIQSEIEGIDLRFSDYVIVDEDRLVVDIDQMIKDSKNFYESSQLVESIVKTVDGFGLEIIFTGKDLILSEISEQK